MKKIYLFVTLLATIALQAQCPTGNLTITSQAQLDNFITTYPDCTQITGNIIIDEANITSLAGLVNIVAITGALEIREVPNLTSLAGLENLQSVGDLILREVDALEEITALSSLESVGGEFTVRSCPELVSLDGVENLTTVGLGLIVRDCASLTSLQGLAGVTTIGEILEVVSNPLLASLAGLENVLSVSGGKEGALVIEGNDALTTLEGLGSAETVFAGSVTISTNGQLSYCSVPSICNYLQEPPADAIVMIGLNVTGCDTEAEVMEACGIVMDNAYFEEAGTGITLLSNPVGAMLAINNATASEGTVAVYDATGKIVLRQALKGGSNTYPADMAAGIYYVRMEAGEITMRVPIIKQ